MSQLLKKVRFYADILLTRETPWIVKILLAVGFLYLIYPFDLITDHIPFLGLLDDFTIGSLLIALAIRLVPTHIIDKVRQKIYYRG